MKPNSVIILFLFTVFNAFFISGCSGSGSGDIGDYFPFLENARYEYIAEPPEFSYKTYNGYIRDNRLQRILTSAAYDSTEILEYADGALRLRYGDPYYYFYEDITEASPNMDKIILMEPLTEGTVWTEENGDSSRITGTDIPVNTAAGSFETIEVTVSSSNGAVSKYYYGKDTGLVKFEYLLSNNTVVTGALETLSLDTALQLDAVFFAPADNGGWSMENRFMILKTNGDFPSQFEKEFQTASPGAPAILAENVKINSIDLQRASSSAYVDLSREFDKENGWGDDQQELIMRCAANTIGNFYGVAQVGFTIENEPFHDLIPVEPPVYE